LFKEFEEKIKQTNVGYIKYRLQAPAIIASGDRLNKYWIQTKKLFYFVQTVLFSMSSLSQNDQQDSFSHWSIALLSEQETQLSPRDRSMRRVS